LPRSSPDADVLAVAASELLGTRRIIPLTFRPLKKLTLLASQNVRPLPEPSTAPWKAARSKKNGSSYRPAVVRPPPGRRLSWPVQPLAMSTPLRHSFRLWTPIPLGVPKL